MSNNNVEFDFDTPTTGKADLFDKLRAATGKLPSAGAIGKRAHTWAAPAWQDLPALLRTMRDGSMLIGVWLMISGVAALAALVSSTVAGISGGFPGYY